MEEGSRRPDAGGRARLAAGGGGAGSHGAGRRGARRPRSRGEPRRAGRARRHGPRRCRWRRTSSRATWRAHWSLASSARSRRFTARSRARPGSRKRSCAIAWRRGRPGARRARPAVDGIARRHRGERSRRALRPPPGVIARRRPGRGARRVGDSRRWTHAAGPCRDRRGSRPDRGRRRAGAQDAGAREARREARHAVFSRGRRCRGSSRTCSGLARHARRPHTPARVDVATFKERFGLSRKYAIPLLEWLDRERVTRRVGDARVIL